MEYKKMTKVELEKFKSEAIRVTTKKTFDSNIRYYDPTVKETVLKNKRPGLVYVERVREF